MSMRIKICGLSTPESVDAAIAAGADWIGFNFFPASPRYVTTERAAALAVRPGVPLRVGLLVKPSDAEVEALIGAVPLDVLQIYADAARTTAIRTRFGRPVWRAVGVGARDDLPRDDEGIDGFLIEAKPPPGATRPGGNAVTFDWSILAGWQAPAPWLLAGGLTVANVAEAIRQTGTKAVDVSSGVERATGVKDPALIAAFAQAARGAVPAA